MGGRRRVLAFLGAFALLLLSYAVFATGAFAHAQLVETTPPDDATVAKPVHAVRLRFNESVSVAFGGAKVWGPGGDRVDSGKAATMDDSKVVVIPIDADGRGSYAVSYRIVSADGHPVHGASTFHVGQRSKDDVSSRKAEAASKGDRRIEVAYGVSRGIALGALMVLAGGLLFRTAIAPGTKPRLLGRAIVFALLAIVASFVLDAANSAGFSIVEVVRWDVMQAEAHTTWGRAAVVQAVLLIAVAIWVRFLDIEDLRPPWRGVLVALPAFLPLLAWSTGGHAIATDPVAIRLPFDMLHMCAAAVWFGGLVQLVLYLRDEAISVEHVERWSRVAFVAVGVLVVSGLYAAYEEIGLSRAAIVDTTYGRLVVAKALLLVGALPFAWLNRQHNVPGLRSGRLHDGGDPRSRLRAYVIGEIAILVFVIAATAALIQTPPARTQVRPDRFDTTVTLRSGATVNVIIDPARSGSNEIHTYAYTENQRVDSAVTNIELHASDSAHGIENLDMKLLPSGPGHWTIPARTIPFAGRWRFTLNVTRGKFDSETAAFTAQIGSAS